MLASYLEGYACVRRSLHIRKMHETGLCLLADVEGAENVVSAARWKAEGKRGSAHCTSDSRERCICQCMPQSTFPCCQPL